MHEHGIVQSLVEKMKQEIGRRPVTCIRGVSLRMGPYATLSPEHLREHLLREMASLGVVSMQVTITQEMDPYETMDGSLTMTSLDFEEDTRDCALVVFDGRRGLVPWRP